MSIGDFLVAFGMAVMIIIAIETPMPRAYRIIAVLMVVLLAFSTYLFWSLAGS